MALRGEKNQVGLFVEAHFLPFSVMDTLILCVWIDFGTQ